MQINRETMLQRNMYVLDKSKELNIPIVIVPGGGYGKDSWEVYYDFLKAALST